jgi:hypothetical protein
MTLGFNDTITSWKVVAMNRFEDRKILVTGAGICAAPTPTRPASTTGAFITGTEIRVDGGAHQ